MNDAFSEYLGRLTHGASTRSIAAKVGMEPTTIARQLNGNLRVQTVVAIVRAYGGDFGEAFVAAGYLTNEEVVQMSAGASLSDATDKQLLEELLSRVEASDTHTELTEPIDLGSRRNVRGGSHTADEGAHAAGADRTQADDGDA